LRMLLALLLVASVAANPYEGVTWPANLTKDTDWFGIVNGRDCRGGEWEGVVMVVGTNGQCGSGGLCTGAWIHPEVVMTAGHCCGAGTTKAICAGLNRPGTKMGHSIAMVTHRNGNNDFCLLHIERTNSAPVTVYEVLDSSVQQWSAMIVGYGVVNSGSPQTGSGVRRDGRVQTNAAGTGVDIRVINRPGNSPWQNACNGDSGGPIFVPKGNDGTMVIAGVTSRGGFQCPVNGASIYTSAVFGTNANSIASTTRNWLGAGNGVTPGQCPTGQTCCYDMTCTLHN